MAENTRVTLPNPLKPIDEANIELRRDVHGRLFRDYRESNCNDKGDQITNLTAGEHAGLKSLKKE